MKQKKKRKDKLQLSLEISILLSATDKVDQTNKDLEEVNLQVFFFNQIDLIDTYRTLQPTMAERTFFSTSCVEIFTKTACALP